MKMQIVALAVLGAAGMAQASNNLSAGYSFSFEFSANATTPFTGPASLETARFNGDRFDSPGPGIDTNVPDLFTAYCVEIGTFLINPSTHKVLPLLGSSTDVTGGTSPSVTFDVTRTKRAQRLWGGFQSSVSSLDSAAAFQLALWEICYDTDMDLGTPGSFFVASGQFQAGITDVAQGWLTTVNSSAVLPEPTLFLLSAPGTQDIITTPAPGTLALLGLGGLVAGRRRR